MSRTVLEVILFVFLFRCVIGDNIFPRLVVGKDYSGLYYVNATFGTPGQIQQLRVDIAQPYTWLVSDNLLLQYALSAYSEMSTVYSPSESTTSETIDGTLVSYNFIDSIAINGTTLSDTMNFTSLDSIDNTDIIEDDYVYWDMSSDELMVSNLSFVLANDTNYVILGALGLGGTISGPTSQTISSANFDDSFYFLSFLKNAGVINCTSFSLWIDDPFVNSTEVVTNSDVGRLLLGAVDSSLFSGDLVSFNAISFYDYEENSISTGYPIVPLTMVGLKNKEGESVNFMDSDSVLPVLIDSRYTYSYLPLNVVIQLAMQTAAVYLDGLDRWVVDCDIGLLDSLIQFQFGNLSISVPTSDFMESTYSVATNSSLYFSTGAEACFLKIRGSYITSYSILGQSFFKNVYLAHDLEGRTIAMGQAMGNVSRNSASNSSVSSISPGSIPFASSSNITQDLTLTYYKDSSSISTDVINQFTASLRSNGEIVTGRTYYVTSKVSGTSTTTSASSLSSSASSKAIALQVRTPLSLLNSKCYLFLFFSIYIFLCLILFI